MSQVSRQQAATRIGPLQIAIIVLTVFTALVHLSRGLALGAPSLRPFPLLFYLNFIGYIVLLVALYWPPLQAIRRGIRWVMVCYAALTVVLWYVITHGHSAFIAYIDKPVELALIVLLILEDRQTSWSRR
jgi:hypothetical protein